MAGVWRSLLYVVFSPVTEDVHAHLDLMDGRLRNLESAVGSIETRLLLIMDRWPLDEDGEMILTAVPQDPPYQDPE